MKKTILPVVGEQEHYAALKIEPIDYILQNGLDYLEGNVIKYVSRYRRKNGVEDLRKARQYLEWLIDRELNNAEAEKESIYNRLMSDG